MNNSNKKSQRKFLCSLEYENCIRKIQTETRLCLVLFFQTNFQSLETKTLLFCYYLFFKNH